MDDVGRKKIQTLICNEIGKRTFDKANLEMIAMMDDITKTAKTYFESVGITLNFIGWADTFSFDNEIQHAVNQNWIAGKLLSSIDVLQAITQLKVQEGLGHGLENHGLPIVISPDTLKIIMGLVTPTHIPAGAGTH